MLDRHEHEPQPVEELDAAERRDSHVQEDAENDRVGDEPEQGRQEDGEADEQGHTEGRNALIWSRKLNMFLSVFIKPHSHPNGFYWVSNAHGISPQPTA